MPGRRSVLGGGALLLGTGAAAAETYPSRPLRLIVPSSPGSATDTVARIVAPGLGNSLGTQVIVENVDGAANVVGMAQLSRAPEDGYTLGVTTSVHVINPYFYNVPYDPIRAFAPVSLLTRGTAILVVPPDSPAHSLAELLALARTRKGDDRLTYGSPGVGTPLHLASALLFAMAGVDLLHVPYSNSYTQYLVDLMAHRLDVAFVAEGTGVPLITSGRLRALAVSTRDRFAALPDVPTVAEAGVPGYATSSWFALVAPAGVPDGVLRQINTATRQALAAERVAAALTKLGYVITPSTPQQALDQFRADYAKYGALVGTLRASGALAGTLHGKGG